MKSSASRFGLPYSLMAFVGAVAMTVVAVETIKAQSTPAPLAPVPSPASQPTAGQSAPEPSIAATAPATPEVSTPAAPTAPHAFSGRDTSLSPQQLQALVGRIAIYPDDLLGLVLTASTQPLEIVEAQRFLQIRKAHPNLNQKPPKTWDPSVIALLNYPDVVKLMDSDLTWTEQLGTSVVEQRAAVLDAIQSFRRQAYAAGNLRSNDKQVVTILPDGAADAEGQNSMFAISPANPQVIYVPAYNPVVVVAAAPNADWSAYDWSSAYPYYGDSDAIFFPEFWYGGFIGFGFGWRDHQIYCGDGHHGHGGGHDHDHDHESAGVDRENGGQSRPAPGGAVSGRTVWNPDHGAAGQMPVRVTARDLAVSGAVNAASGARTPQRPIVIRPLPQMANGGGQVNGRASVQAFHGAPSTRNATTVQPRGGVAASPTSGVTGNGGAVRGGFAGAGTAHH